MAVGPTTFVGVFQEFGTVVHGAQPFMRPAWDAGRDKVLKDFGVQLWKAIARTVKRLARQARKAKR